MNRATKTTIPFFLGLILVVAATAQQTGAPDDGNKKSSESYAGANTAHSDSAAHNVPEGMSKEQADAVLNELRQIRKLLEKQEAERAPGVTPPVAATAAPERIQMNVGSGWNSIGRSDAPVTVVEFADFECPYCKRFQSGTFTDLKKSYIDTGKVRWVARDLPLDRHANALRAAEAARCAGDQGKYWEMHDALLASDAPPNDEVIKKSTEAVMLDWPGLQRCIDSGKFLGDVRKDAAEAAALQLAHTPTFVVAKSETDKLDGAVIVGSQSFATFQTAIDKLLTH
jgi:protein-disulfide isomerase